LVRGTTSTKAHGRRDLRGRDKQNQTQRNDLQNEAHGTSAYIKLCAKQHGPQIWTSIAAIA
jgi:hypothetical protein